MHSDHVGATTTAHWRYFLALDDDLEKLSRYVEFSQGNKNCYSIEMTRLFLTACSEVDVVAKLLCKSEGGNSKAAKIDEYREILHTTFPSIAQFQVIVGLSGFTLQPWKGWEVEETPQWWKDHQDVKHQRDEHYGRANLSNVLNSISGLFVLVLHLDKKAAHFGELHPSPRILKPARQFYGGHSAGGNLAYNFD